ncbi:ImmA/IrrE family metallo-endopeptidase [Halalkalibacterium halodurans]|uniref:ImmA/IrrE family metallo-endopeptidase n=1 Tax=Halalkalibacterium halodurans TaxID=86665 RepID=UPI0010FE4EA7|nr:ImmA/IrrE family metallo-endopeptidase [Halalkalibacterium halodurans]
MRHVKGKVNELIKKYETSNPFKIATCRDIHINYESLGNIMGYYTQQFRIQMIYINEDTTEKERLFICAHELGHAILHPEANTPFLKRHTLYSTDRIEQEANYFAAELLFYDKTLTSSEVIHEYGVPYEVIKNF